MRAARKGNPQRLLPLTSCGRSGTRPWAFTHEHPPLDAGLMVLPKISQCTEVHVLAVRKGPMIDMGGTQGVKEGWRGWSDLSSSGARSLQGRGVSSNQIRCGAAEQLEAVARGMNMYVGEQLQGVAAPIVLRTAD